MSQETSATRVVLVAAVDATPSAEGVAATAAALAARIAGAELHLLHVLTGVVARDPDVLVPAPVSAIALLEDARDLIERATAKARPLFAGRIVAHLGVGDACREILQLAESVQADVLVVGTRGNTGFDRLLAGSVAEHVVRRAKCPVVVARPKDYHTKATPEIEPACADCLETQRTTRGEELWCARHVKQHHLSAKLHYEYPEPFAVGSLLIRDS